MNNFFPIGFNIRVCFGCSQHDCVVLGAQKNCFIEMVHLSTHNMFWYKK